MKIYKKNNNLIISFDYSAALVQIIKQFESRKFDAKTKEWYVPILHIVSVMNKLTPLGFIASNDVKNEYNTAIKKEKKIQKILASEFNEKEIDLFKQTKLPLFNFQMIGVGFLCTTKSALLADEPGMGKTIQTLAFMLINKTRKNLIVCPSTLKRNWIDEINKWISNPKIYLVEGPKKKRDEIYKKVMKEKKVFFLIINYELLRVDIKELKKI